MLPFMRFFARKPVVPVSLAFNNPNETSINPANANAVYTLDNAGNGSSTNQGTWPWLLSGAVADYEVRCTVTAGALTAGTTGSWLALTTTRTWSLLRNTLGTSTCTCTIEVRLAVGGAVVASQTVFFSATKDV